VVGLADGDLRGALHHHGVDLRRAVSGRSPQRLLAHIDGGERNSVLRVRLPDG
jgi:hypothetical protein